MEIKKGTNKFYIGNNENDFVAEITYFVDSKNRLAVNHTFVDHSLRGKGIARQLVLKMIDYAKLSDQRIVPLCSYVISFFKSNKEYQSVLAEDVFLDE